MGKKKLTTIANARPKWSMVDQVMAKTSSQKIGEKSFKNGPIRLGLSGPFYGHFFYFIKVPWTMSFLRFSTLEIAIFQVLTRL